jgi:WD40 repeat protein
MSESTVQHWDLATGTVIGKLRHPRLTEFATHPDGQHIMTGGGATLRVWRVAAGELLRSGFGRNRRYIGEVAFWPNDAMLAIAGAGGVEFVPDGTDSRLRGVPNTPISASFSSNRANYAVFSQFDPSMKSAGTLGWIYLLPHGTGARPFPFPEWVLDLALSPDATRLVTVHGEYVRLWDVSSHSVALVNMHMHPGVLATAFHPQGAYFVTAAEDGTVKRWDAIRAWPPLGQLLVHEGGISAMAFSPDGERLATAGGDQTLRLWDTETGLPIFRPIHFSGLIPTVTFASDGKAIVTGHTDGGVRMWDVATGEQLGPAFFHLHQVVTAAISSDGQRILSGGHDGGARLWRAPRPMPGSLEDIKRMIEADTGIELRENDGIRRLNVDAWRQRKLNRDSVDAAPAAGQK